MSPLVEHVSGSQVNIAGQVAGDFIINYAERAPADYMLDFGVDAEAAGFVGRADVLAELDRFAGGHRSGYFEVVAEAGLGKTALACAIAAQRNAIVFLASASRGTERTSTFLQHTVASLIVRHLPERATLPAQTTDSGAVLRRTLEEAAATSGGEPIWLVVDGLDEAEPAPAGANPLLLPVDLPLGVFAVVTRRAGRLLTGPFTPVARYALRHDDDEQKADVEAFVRDRIAQDARIAAALQRSSLDPDEFVEALTRRSDGSFVYLQFVLADIAERPGEIDLRRLPDRLLGYYDQYWQAMSAVRQADWELWAQLFKPVLERLVVAAEPVPAAWLAAQTGRSADEIEARVLEPWDRVLDRVDRDGVTVWRLLHRTVAEHLETTGKVDAAAAHRAVGESYARRAAAAYADWDEYGLRHAVRHLVHAAERLEGNAAAALVSSAARLAADGELVRRRLALDPAGVQDDLLLAIARLSGSRAPDATSSLVALVLTLLSFRRSLVDAGWIFAAAERGEVTGAERLLDLFGSDLDDEWCAAQRLTIAWLGAGASPVEARALRERTVAEAVFSDPSSLLARLDEHLQADLAGRPCPASEIVEAPDTAAGESIVASMAGAEAALGSPYAELLDPDGGYLAREQAPVLVALAYVRPQEGERLLADYIGRHAAYGYPRYRAGSLRWVLDAALRPADGARVRPWVTAIGTALLAPAQAGFAEALEIASLTARTRLGGEDATVELLRRTASAISTAAALPAGAGTGGPLPGGVDRGASDLWGLHRRRLAALAESAAVRGLDGEARALLDAAFQIDGGFAGYTAPAYLTLAEAASLVAEDDGLDRAEWFDTYARQAAENIRDPVHCLRTTARVRALTVRWAASTLGAHGEEAAARLRDEPAAPEFAALHVVGAALTERTGAPLSPPPEAASTLRQIAELYDRSVHEIVRVNGGGAHGPDDPLDAGSHVDVPDPTCAPLVAARFAAAALRETGDGERSIRLLLETATADATAAITTLARLLLAASPVDGADLDAIEAFARAAVGQTREP